MGKLTKMFFVAVARILVLAVIFNTAFSNIKVVWAEETPTANTQTQYDYSNYIIEEERIWIPNSSSIPSVDGQTTTTYETEEVYIEGHFEDTEEWIPDEYKEETVKVSDGYWKPQTEWIPEYYKTTTETVPGYFKQVQNWVSGYYRDVQKWVSGYYRDVQKWVDGYYRTVQKWVDGYYKTVRKWVDGYYRTVQKWVDGYYKTVQKWVSGYYKSVQKWVSGYYKTVQKWVPGYYRTVQKMVSGKLTVVQEWVSGYYTTTQEWVSGYYTVVQEWVSGYYTTTQEWVSGYYTVVQEWVSGYYTTVQEWVSGYYTVVQEWVSGYYTTVQEWVNGYYTTSREWVDGYYTTSNVWVPETTKEVKELVAGYYKTVDVWVDAKYDTVQTLIPGHYKQVWVEGHTATVIKGTETIVPNDVYASDGELNIFQKFGKWISTIWNDLTDLVGNTWNDVKNLVGEAYNDIKEKIISLVNNARQKIADLISSITSTFVNMLKNAFIGTLEFLDTRQAKAVLGTLQAVGGGIQVAVGVALCGSGIGAVLGVPVILHAVADIGQGAATAINAIADKNILPEVNFMEALYAYVGGLIGGAIGGEKGKEIGSKIGTGAFTAVDIVISMITVEGGLKTLNKLMTMDNVGDVLKFAGKTLTDGMTGMVKSIGGAASSVVNSIKKIPDILTTASSTVADFGKAIGDSAKLFSDIWKKQPASTGTYISSNFGGEISKLSDKLEATIKEFKSTLKGTGELIPNIIPNKGFDSFTKLKTYLGDAGDGKAWHHIVEQSQVGARAGFAVDEVNNVKNVISIPTGSGTVHSKISAHYSSKFPDLTGDLTVRDWLATKSFDEQFEYGKELLEQYGEVIATESGWIFKQFE